MRHINDFHGLTAVSLFIFCISCSNPVPDSQYSVKAKEAISEVINHYKVADPSPYKLKAALFLIDNMWAHYSYASDRIYSYYEIAASVLSDTTLTRESQRDCLLYISDSMFPCLSDSTVSDIELLVPDYLIDNIDKSYDQWRNCPWADQITFDEFLEWLLPYKGVEYQELDLWRDTLFLHFATGLIDPVINDVEYNTCMGVADMIRSQASGCMDRYGLYTRSGYPLLSAYLLPRQTFGNIPDYTLVGLLAMRAAGVPAVMDETPVGARYTAATKWFVIKSDRGEELTSEWDLSTVIGAGFFPYERGPKVFRNTYAVDDLRLQYSRKAKYVYPFGLCKKDVTERYFLTCNPELPIQRSVRKKLKDKYVYIASAVRSGDSNWCIVDFGTIKHGKACFRNMGREVLYVIMGYDGRELVPITDPFILHKDCSIEYVSNDTINSNALDKWKNNAL